MDMNSLLRGMLPTAAMANATTSGVDTNATMPANIVENILPLIGLKAFVPMYSFLGSSLGWDPTYLLTTLGFVWASNKVFRQIYNLIYGLITEHLMSTIHVSSTDDIYLHLMKWLALQPKMVNSRALTAETASKTAWEDEDASSVGRDRTGSYLNFSNQEARAPPHFFPAVGLHNFWWRGQYYRLHRKKESVFDDGSSGGLTTFKDKEDLVISCLWRSPEPIKHLLAHAKQSYYSDHQARTIVKRPAPQNMRRYGGRYNWQQVANRPVRDMRTVVLDQRQKLQVLADINEYLHPDTPRWYANRGIPLRRGYLFHGPPGTGKTSLSFALAGVFGLDIHVISLLEPSLTEEDLSSLFNSLPRRCVVLLEDIDTAGLRRPAEDLEAQEKKKPSSGKDETKGHPNDWKVSDLAKALKKDTDDQKKGISLSGLLNSIDGVASHEGRVLIMTTNVPESLDDALIRPGRVDLQVGFTNATKDQAQELFVRMYEGDQGRPQHSKQPDAVMPNLHGTSNGSAELNGHALAPETSSAKFSGELDISIDELPTIAKQFAEKIPDNQFSPAEIQGYLLKRKKHPRRALEEAEKWAKSLVEQKASKTKILQVQ
ncbi:P-loop containing nucleoside triphosphate hydrolase protein [Xylariaceae sp. FL0016]|nr:P-loop containing nucleoside triphosphate hydrolase protein [Xylariaceae sp. FL0016]